MYRRGKYYAGHQGWRLAVSVRFLAEGLSQERQDILRDS